MTYQQIRKLARGYLHQDYDLVDGTIERAVGRFHADQTDDAVIRELEAVAAAYPERGPAEQFWREEIKLEVRPPGFGVAYEDFATWLLARATSAYDEEKEERA